MSGIHFEVFKFFRQYRNMIMKINHHVLFMKTHGTLFLFGTQFNDTLLNSPDNFRKRYGNTFCFF